VDEPGRDDPTFAAGESGKSLKLSFQRTDEIMAALFTRGHVTVNNVKSMLEKYRSAKGIST
jgi:hypothetical protein